MKLLAFSRVEPFEGGELNLNKVKGHYRDVLRADPCAYCGDILSPREQAWQRQQGWDYASVDHIRPLHRNGLMDLPLKKSSLRIINLEGHGRHIELWAGANK